MMIMAVVVVLVVVVVISLELESIFTCFYGDHVPPALERVSQGRSFCWW